MSRTRRYVTIAAVCALLTAVLLLANQMRGNRQRNQELEEMRAALGKTVPVVVARELIAAGTTLTEELLEAKSVLASDASSSGLVDSVEKAVGLTALMPLYPNEPLIADKIGLGETASAVTASGYVPAGHVAFALPINPETAVGGVIAVRDRIDIIAALDERTAVLLQDVSVLGIAGEFPFGSQAVGAFGEGQEASGLGFGAPSARALGGPTTGAKILILDLTLEDAVALADALHNHVLYVALHSSQSEK